MAKTVVGLFDDYATAEAVLRDLQALGFPRADISVAASDPGRADPSFDHYPTVKESESGAGRNAAVGAGVGAALGGGVGLALGLGALMIPGIGPIIAAGPIAATLAGAGIGMAAGGFVGALTLLGIPHDVAYHYAEGVRRGCTLVTVKSEDGDAYRAADVMNDHGAIDVEARAAYWRSAGYKGHSAHARPFTMEDVARERAEQSALRKDRFAQTAGLGNRQRAYADDYAAPAGERGERVTQPEFGAVKIYRHAVDSRVSDAVTVRRVRSVRAAPVSSPSYASGSAWDSVAPERNDEDDSVAPPRDTWVEGRGRGNR